MHLNNKQGVTLIELLIVIAVIGLAMVPASRALMNGLNTYATESENLERVYEAQDTLDYITDIIRVRADKAISIVEVTGLSTIPNSEGVGRGLKIDDTIIYQSNKNEIKIIEKGIDKVLLENAVDFILPDEDIEYVTYKNVTKLSRFSVAIELEKREAPNETFKTMIYLRNK